MRFSDSGEEQTIDRIVAFVEVGVAERRQEGLELADLVGGYLEPDQDAAVIRALVPVMEQADIPVRRHRRQKAHQRTRPFREFEAEQALVMRERRTAAHHVTDMLLRQFVAGPIDDGKTVALE